MLRLLCISFVFTLSIGVSYVIIPLYAHHLEFSGVSIGSLFTLPMILQVIIRFIGGPLSDRFGPKKILLFALLALTLSGVVFYFATTYILLLIGQIILVVGRGLYWPVIQTLVSHISTEYNLTMGKLNASSNAGQLGGLIVSGLLISTFGYNISFLFFTIVGISVLSIAIFLPSPHQSTTVRSSKSAFKQMFVLIKEPIMFFAMLCAFLAAQPHVIGQSFHPIYMEDVGLMPDSIGFIMSLRAVGGILIGSFLAKFIKPTQSLVAPVMCGIVTAGVFLITPMFDQVYILAFIFLGFGMASEVMAISYQVIASETSKPDQRASALVVAGLGWSLSHLISPVIFGLLVDVFNLFTAFYIWGGFILLVGVSAVPLYRLAFSKRGCSVDYNPPN